MVNQSSSGPVKFERIQISKQRSINIKLWAPANHSQWGMTRATIEIQEARKNEEDQISYGKALRIPCDGTAAILANYLSSYLIEGRNLNQVYKNNIKSSQNESKSISLEEIEKMLISQFNNQKLSKTRILQSLNAKGLEIDSDVLVNVLESLVDTQQISKESAIHSGSGNTYTLWHFTHTE